MRITGSWSPSTAALALILLGHSIILLVVEPAMGFRSASDYFDLARVIPALQSPAWFVSNSLHAALGAALLLFQSELRSAGIGQRTLPADFCVVAAPLFVVIGMSGFVGKDLLDLLQSNPGGLEAALYGQFAVRTHLLAAAIALVGMMILSISLRSDVAALWLRVLGLPIGIAAILFVLIPSPIPVLLLVWIVAFGFGRLR